MGLNETFPAKFQHLYTTLTWRFLGWSARDTVCCEYGPRPTVYGPLSWSGAREPLSVVSLPPPSFGLHPSLERQSRFELRAMEPAVCWMSR
jgi:hypothetical protein